MANAKNMFVSVRVLLYTYISLEYINPEEMYQKYLI